MHITEFKNIKSILENGLDPTYGDLRSGESLVWAYELKGKKPRKKDIEFSKKVSSEVGIIFNSVPYHSDYRGSMFTNTITPEQFTSILYKGKIYDVDKFNKIK